MTTSHPLVGKVLRYDVDDGDSYMISRFVADLGDGYFLRRRISPHNYSDLPMSHILSLGYHANEERSDIYEDIDALKESMEENPAVGKLVRVEH
jgi:hypothetical protein